MKHIGIFVFIGVLSVVFHDHGWLPNENIYAISQLVYKIVLPALIAFEAGRMTAGPNGGIQAVLAVSGLLMSGNFVGILGAMILGPLCGKIWKYEENIIERWIDPGFQMLTKNLALGIIGCGLAVSSYYLLSPLLILVPNAISPVLDLMVSYQLIGLFSFVIEPLKVFFLNNVINHTILIPLGMKQLLEAGSSVLFLLETNPGPGFGVLTALCYINKENRNEYLSAMIAQAAGGIHEVYFPYIWSDFRLLIPLILGGAAGNICFALLHAGLQGMVSPGSIFIILFMAGKDLVIPVSTGIILSAAVSFAGSLLVLRMGNPPPKNQTQNPEKLENKKMTTVMEKKIDKIGFVCDGGVGSSAMGAAIFRRMLAQKRIEGILVKAYSADLVPEEIDIIVCQRDFFELLPDKLKEKSIYKVESLVKAEEYKKLFEQIQRRNEGK